MKGQVEIPQTSEELEELLHDDSRVTDLLTNGQWGDFTAQYIAKSMENQRAELGAQMREQMQLGQQQILQTWAEQGMTPQNGFRPGGSGVSNRDARRSKAVAKAGRRIRDADYLADAQCLFSPAAIGAVTDDEPFAQSMRAFMYEMIKAESVARDQGDNARIDRVQDWKRKLYNASMSERIPSEGGFLVPEVLRSEILMFALEQSVVRPRARVVPMDSLRTPLPSIDDESHASNVYGGVAAYWTAEGATLSATAPKWGRVELEARKLTAYTTIPNELLQDSITPLDTWFNMFFPRAMAWFEDMAFISGGGVGEPQGYINSPAAISLTPTGGANTLQFADVAKMYTRMWPQSLNNAVWLCSPDTLQLLIQIAVAPTYGSSNTQGVPVAPPGWLSMTEQAIGYPGGGNGDGVTYKLMGRPLVVSEKIPSSASGNTTQAGALSFVDFDYYLLGDRQSMQIATSDEYLFTSDLVAYRVIERLDGRVWPQSAITPANGSADTLSPVVLLNTPA